jgi:hypothetical protein
MNGTPWTSEADATLKQYYKQKPVAWIASRLKKTKLSVYQRARKLGLNKRRDQLEIDSRKLRIKAFLKIGMSDSEVAARVGMKRRVLTEMRIRMGIQANGRNERYRQRMAKKLQEQCQAAGVKSLAEIRSKRFSEFSSSLGWYGLTVRAAQIAEALYRLGPMTRLQICEAIGIPWRGSRKSLSNGQVPGGSYMSELQRAGIVVRLRAAITHKGKGNKQDLYMIGLGVEPCKE